jgi:hypothetical protein
VSVRLLGNPLTTGFSFPGFPMNSATCAHELGLVGERNVHRKIGLCIPKINKLGYAGQCPVPGDGHWHKLIFCCGPISINYSSCATVAEFLGRPGNEEPVLQKKKKKTSSQSSPTSPCQRPSKALQGHYSQNKGSTNSSLKWPQGKGPQ